MLRFMCDIEASSSGNVPGICECECEAEKDRGKERETRVEKGILLLSF